MAFKAPRTAEAVLKQVETHIGYQKINHSHRNFQLFAGIKVFGSGRRILFLTTTEIPCFQCNSSECGVSTGETHGHHNHLQRYVIKSIYILFHVPLCSYIYINKSNLKPVGLLCRCNGLQRNRRKHFSQRFHMKLVNSFWFFKMDSQSNIHVKIGSAFPYPFLIFVSLQIIQLAIFSHC